MSLIARPLIKLNSINDVNTKSKERICLETESSVEGSIYSPDNIISVFWKDVNGFSKFLKIVSLSSSASSSVSTNITAGSLNCLNDVLLLVST